MRLQRGKYLVSCVEDSLVTRTVTEQDSVTTWPTSTMQVKFNSDIILAISVMTANEKQHMIQCAKARLNEISNSQIPVQENIFYPIYSTVLFILSLRGCAVLEDAETDAIEAGAEEVNVTDEKSGTLEFVSPDNDLVTVKGCLVKARYE